MKKLLFAIVFLSSLLLGSNFDEKYNMGQDLYKKTCAACHGADGYYKDMKFLVNPRELRSSILTQEQSYKIIRDGAHAWGAKSDIMPSFKTVFSDEQIKAIAYYISKEFNPNIEKRIADEYAKSDNVPQEKVAGMLKRGKKIYNRNCAWCHGTTGKGDGLATKSPIDSIFPYDLNKTPLTNEQMFLYTKFGGKYWGAYKDDMPAWGKKYNDYTIKSIVKYMNEVVITKEK